MTDSKRYRRRLQARAAAATSPVCEYCGARRPLEYAHVTDIEPTGRGRGSKARYLSIIRHPEAYRRLCHDCHRWFDLSYSTAEDLLR